MVHSLQPLARIPPLTQHPTLLPQILGTLPQLHPQKTLADLQIRHRLLGLRSPLSGSLPRNHQPPPGSALFLLYLRHPNLYLSLTRRGRAAPLPLQSRQSYPSPQDQSLRQSPLHYRRPGADLPPFDPALDPPGKARLCPLSSLPHHRSAQF